MLFRLAGLVAEVAHNAAGPSPFFDHHAGWGIGPLAHRLAIAAHHTAVRDRVAARLRRPFLTGRRAAEYAD
ncbi:hypothetical protein [Streptomyces sp. HUAS ZL42]|uniref:hypothetical protein n=1 Tax=Streptomyces sp. HUAS ZL42 TaxID=3231715 RepID=UPI00345E1A71